MPLRSRCRLEWFCNTAVRTGGLWPSLLFSDETVESTALQLSDSEGTTLNWERSRCMSSFLIHTCTGWILHETEEWKTVRNDEQVWQKVGRRRSSGMGAKVRSEWCGSNQLCWQPKKKKRGPTLNHTADSDSKEFPPNPNQMETLSKAAKYEVSFKTQSEMKTRNCAGGGQSNLCSLTGLHATLTATC